MDFKGRNPLLLEKKKKTINLPKCVTMCSLPRRKSLFDLDLEMTINDLRVILYLCHIESMRVIYMSTYNI